MEERIVVAADTAVVGYVGQEQQKRKQEQQVSQSPGGLPAVVGSAWAPEVEEQLRLFLAPLPRLTSTPILPA